MKCKDASLALIRLMFAAPAEQERGELSEHLRTCPRCIRRADRYRAIRDEVASMDRVALPPEAQQMLMEGLRESIAVPSGRPKAPADPRSESTTLYRALFFTCAMLAVGLVTVGLLMAFRGEMKPVPLVAQVSYWGGKVYAQTAGASNWHEMSRRDAILPGTALHTDPDAVLALTAQTACWWMDGSSALALGDAGMAELAQGRVCALCTAPEQQPVRLMTTAGTVTCGTGQFVARMSLTRLTVACISGSVSVGPAEAPTRLAAGQEAVLADGKVLGPVRTVRVAELTEWLKRFAPGYGEGLTPRRMASVPLTPEQPALPDGVSIEELNVSLTARGPLVLLKLSGRLHNAADQPRQAALSAEGLVLPGPLAETGPVRVDLPAGGDGEFELNAVCVLVERLDHCILGLNPRAWTDAPVRRLALRADVSAVRGLRTVSMPAQGLNARRQDRVEWSWTAADYAPDQPIVLDVEPGKPGSADALRLATPLGDWALWAWRPETADYAWIRKGCSVLVAFDATADFGPGGAAGAQEVLEVLLQAIPPAVPTALVAYDGNLGLDRNPWSPNLPPRVEALLGTIWCLDPQGRAAAAGADFLASAVELAGGAKGRKLLIYITGAGEPADTAALEALRPSDDMQVVVVQVGARRAAAAYSALCARSGGAAIALDPDEAARLAGFDLLVALQWAAVRTASVEAGGAPGAVVLAGPGGFANAPVVALVPLAGGGAGGTMRAQVGGKAVARQIGPPARPEADCDGAQAQALVGAMLAGAASRVTAQK